MKNKRFPINKLELKIKQVVSLIMLLVGLAVAFLSDFNGNDIVGMFLIGFAVGFSIWENFVSLFD